VHWLLLIRPLNLLVIVLTMYGSWYYVMATNSFQPIASNPYDFFLLVFSTVLIAAAGNIINDYFDVRADRINRPEKLILTKHLKKRWAIIAHWVINGLAFSIAIYLSIKYESLWFVFIHLASINLLWFYSLILKRKVLVGNLIIAILTGLVPLLVVCFFKAGNEGNFTFSEFLPESWNTSIDFSVIYFLSLMAVIQNFIREILKDIPDIEGDKKSHVLSIPMVLGIRPTLFFSAALLLILPLFTLLIAVDLQPYPTISQLNWKQLVPLFSCAAINIGCITMVFMKHSEQNVSFIDNLIKLSFFVGLTLCFTVPHFSK
jgi:4-hydroxybenzoate polyprenyltransferase